MKEWNQELGFIRVRKHQGRLGFERGSSWPKVIRVSRVEGGHSSHWGFGRYSREI